MLAFQGRSDGPVALLQGICARGGPDAVSGTREIRAQLGVQAVEALTRGGVLAEMVAQIEACTGGEEEAHKPFVATEGGEHQARGADHPVDSVGLRPRFKQHAHHVFMRRKLPVTGKHKRAKAEHACACLDTCAMLQQDRHCRCFATEGGVVERGVTLLAHHVDKCGVGHRPLCEGAFQCYNISRHGRVVHLGDHHRQMVATPEGGDV